jgi:hypothetical protein
MSEEDKLVQQEVGVGGHLDILVTEVVDINKFWINVRTTDTLGAREKVMDCMDLFYKMEGKDMYVEKVFTGSVVAAPYYQEGYHRVKVISVVKDIIGVNYFDFGTVLVVGKDQLRVSPGMFSLTQSGH